MLTPDDLRHPQDVQIIQRSVALLRPGSDALRREDALMVLDALMDHLHPDGEARPRQPSCGQLTLPLG